MKIFLEKQFLNRMWLFMFILAIILIVVGTSYYATANAEDDTAITVSLISIAIALPLSISLLYLRLETRIDEKGILTVFSPFHFTKKFIPWDNIEDCYIRKYNSSEEFGGWGLRGLGRNWKAYNVEGNHGIEIITKDGKNVLIGTM
ncbi:MAG TPA: hypothetical protein VFM59_06690, partial [Salinimicrobium sp.]|nr:hypothetical protein [Salinimicrobium sp.]